MQVAPIRPTLKAPGTQRFKLKYDQLLSILLEFAFKFNLRRYAEAIAQYTESINRDPMNAKVGRCNLTLSNPR